MAMKPIKIIRFARGFAVGRVLGEEVPFGIRQTLLDCGRAVEIEPEESAAVPSTEREHRRPARVKS